MAFAYGGAAGVVLSRPTYETPPGRLLHWLPQRTRWLKGYMQTVLVHTRSLSGMGWRGWSALALTLGTALASAALHAFSVAWIVSFALMVVFAGHLLATLWLGLAILFSASGAAILTTAIGAKRAGVPFAPWDMLLSPIYWSLLSHALVRLVAGPHRWDKTAHQPDVADQAGLVTSPSFAPEAGRAAA